MTLEEAEDAARNDPRVIERQVRTFLEIEKVSDLYKPGMTFEEAEDAARNDLRVKERQMRTSQSIGV